jgi:hypothetical protein
MNPDEVERMFADDLPKMKRECAALVAYAESKVEACRQDVLAPGRIVDARYVASAALLRLPKCLEALILLTDAGLSLEADGAIRTIVESTIRICWVGLDDARAAKVRDASLADRGKGLERVFALIGTEEKDSEQGLEPRRAPRPKALKFSQMVREAVDYKGFDAHDAAKVMYGLMYDALSAASHGDIRFAGLVAKGAEARLVPMALRNGLSAALFLLKASAATLGFSEECKEFLRREGLKARFTGAIG